ncbi:hypothetical protein H696_00359 [Fonticula alba]|uniref:Uncharacterized protein n=1 Tax=Fonticula alba TaxID=691883 RepID=A0A058ZEE7_FONAL|nr:hypothetical protein H696_00359 [Fonticula alba]KCV72780.1 hypothetical protein H696_00359 [Fonticula alba]|eukprot:XP_009492481.1 hypothetical protein H696_00359 [Fonticula alba]
MSSPRPLNPHERCIFEAIEQGRLEAAAQISLEHDVRRFGPFFSSLASLVTSEPDASSDPTHPLFLAAADQEIAAFLGRLSVSVVRNRSVHQQALARAGIEQSPSTSVSVAAFENSDPNAQLSMLLSALQGFQDARRPAAAAASLRDLFEPAWLAHPVGARLGLWAALAGDDTVLRPLVDLALTLLTEEQAFHLLASYTGAFPAALAELVDLLAAVCCATDTPHAPDTEGRAFVLLLRLCHSAPLHHVSRARDALFRQHPAWSLDLQSVLSGAGAEPSRPDPSGVAAMAGDLRGLLLSDMEFVSFLSVFQPDRLLDRRLDLTAGASVPQLTHHTGASLPTLIRLQAVVHAVLFAQQPCDLGLHELQACLEAGGRLGELAAGLLLLLPDLPGQEALQPLGESLARVLAASSPAACAYMPLLLSRQSEVSPTDVGQLLAGFQLDLPAEVHDTAQQTFASAGAGDRLAGRPPLTRPGTGAQAPALGRSGPSHLLGAASAEHLVLAAAAALARARATHSHMSLLSVLAGQLDTCVQAWRQTAATAGDMALALRLLLLDCPDVAPAEWTDWLLAGLQSASTPGLLPFFEAYIEQSLRRAPADFAPPSETALLGLAQQPLSTALPAVVFPLMWNERLQKFAATLAPAASPDAQHPSGLLLERDKAELLYSADFLSTLPVELLLAQYATQAPGGGGGGGDGRGGHDGGSSHGIGGAAGPAAPGQALPSAGLLGLGATVPLPARGLTYAHLAHLLPHCQLSEEQALREVSLRLRSLWQNAFDPVLSSLGSDLDSAIDHVLFDGRSTWGELSAAGPGASPPGGPDGGPSPGRATPTQAGIASSPVCPLSPDDRVLLTLLALVAGDQDFLQATERGAGHSTPGGLGAAAHPRGLQRLALGGQAAAGALSAEVWARRRLRPWLDANPGPLDPGLPYPVQLAFIRGWVLFGLEDLRLATGLGQLDSLCTGLALGLRWLAGALASGTGVAGGPGGPGCHMLLECPGPSGVAHDLPPADRLYTGLAPGAGAGRARLPPQADDMEGAFSSLLAGQALAEAFALDVVELFAQSINELLDEATLAPDAVRLKLPILDRLAPYVSRLWKMSVRQSDASAGARLIKVLRPPMDILQGAMVWEKIFSGYLEACRVHIDNTYSEVRQRSVGTDKSHLTTISEASAALFRTTVTAAAHILLELGTTKAWETLLPGAVGQLDVHELLPLPQIRQVAGRRLNELLILYPDLAEGLHAGQGVPHAGGMWAVRHVPAMHCCFAVIPRMLDPRVSSPRRQAFAVQMSAILARKWPLPNWLPLARSIFTPGNLFSRSDPAWAKARLARDVAGLLDATGGSLTANALFLAASLGLHSDDCPTLLDSAWKQLDPLVPDAAFSVDEPDDA